MLPIQMNLRINAFVLALCVFSLLAADKPQDWKTGIVLAVESVVTGLTTNEKGQVDRQGSYSGRSQSEESRATEYVIRDGDTFYRLRPIQRGRAIYAIPYVGLGAMIHDSRKAPPDVSVKDSIRFTANGAKSLLIDKDGKQFDAQLIASWLATN
jgi:hypothetical protein